MNLSGFLFAVVFLLKNKKIKKTLQSIGVGASFQIRDR